MSAKTFSLVAGVIFAVVALFHLARIFNEPYVAGDEGIRNRRDRPALEISVEDRKIEVGFPRRLQCLVDARGLGSDGIAELT